MECPQVVESVKKNLQEIAPEGGVDYEISISTLGYTHNQWRNRPFRTLFFLLI